MAKNKKTAPKKAEASNPNDSETSIQDSASLEDKCEDANEAVQENGDDENLTKKSKGRASKKEELEDPAKEEEAENNQQNGAGDSIAKKKQAQKNSKTTRPHTEPERKSSRTPKLVPKETVAEKTVNDNKGKENKGKKRTASKSPSKASKKTKEAEKDYEVEKIVGLRVKKGKKEFKIRWKGYKPNDDSWEPEKNLSCHDLITKYLEEHKDEAEENEKKPSKKSSPKNKKRKTKAK